jgi:hypothetical protein
MRRILIFILSSFLLFTGTANAGKYFNGAGWVDTVRKRYNGTAWADTTTKRFNGSTWEALNSAPDDECTNFIVCENFEEGTTPEDWTFHNSAVTTPALRGSYSARLSMTAGAPNIDKVFSDTAAIYGHFLWSTTLTLGSAYSVMMTAKNDGESMVSIQYNDANFRIYHGSTYSTLGAYTLTPNTPYHIWFYFNATTNYSEVRIAPLATFTQPNILVSTSSGSTVATDFNRVTLPGSGYAGTNYHYIDQVLIKGTEFTGVSE